MVPGAVELRMHSVRILESEFVAAAGWRESPAQRFRGFDGPFFVVLRS